MEIDIARKIRITTRSINVVYYTIYLLTIVAVLVIFFLTYSNAEISKIDSMSSSGISISSIYLIFLLISIPASLFLFYRYTLKIKQETDYSIMLNKYRKASVIRLWIVGIGLIAGIVLVYLLRLQSMIFTAAIAAIALYFCKPSAQKLIRELDLDIDIKDLNIKKRY